MFFFQGLLQEELCHTALKKCHSFIIDSMKLHQQPQHHQQISHVVKNNRQTKNMKMPSLRREIRDSRRYRDLVIQVFQEQNEDEKVLLQ